MRKGILMLILITCFGITVSAHDIPDSGRLGSVKITAELPGGTMTFYRVGEVTEEDGDYSFALTGDFINSGASLADIHSPELAAQLAQYASEHHLQGITKPVSDEIYFEKLELGLYLFLQHQAAEGYCRIEPFLVTIPMWDGVQYIYDVDAAPKISEIIPTESQLPQPSGPSDPVLPQTGQLKWPVAVLSVLGLGLSAVGWVLKRRI